MSREPSRSEAAGAPGSSASPGSSDSSERARLFVAVWPPPSVLAVLASRRGPDQSGVRWMGPEHWHVTLRFLGTVDVAKSVDALSRLAGAPGALAVVGSTPARLGREVIALPVDGLSRLAAAVDTAFAGLGRDPDHRPFRGHLTLSQLANSTGGSMIGTSQHSDCCAASKAMRCHRSTCALTRSARGRAMTRCEMSGAIALTPSSVAF